MVAFFLFGTALADAPESTEQLLQHADHIKLTDNDAFQGLLAQLDQQAATLTTVQRDWLEYLRAWQLGYRGDYPHAVAAFDALIARTQDANVRARARISLLFDQVNSANYQDAYITLNELLDSQPKIEDRNTHFLIFAAANYVYGEAGQYDLAIQYIDKALAYASSDRNACIAIEQKTETLATSGKLRVDDAQIRNGLDTCERAGDPIGLNIIRMSLAQALLDQHHAADALKLLKAHEAEVLATHSSALNSAYNATLARAYLATHDLAQAKVHAQTAVEHANNQFYARSVADAYNVLYMVTKQQGDDAAALAWHEKYAAADKGYLSDVSARALAFQMVHQRVLDNQRQLQAANDKNAVLALQQQVDAQKAQTRLLVVLLLLCGLLIVGGWAYRTKRSQLKFQKLARMDSLTGIFNRQHFFDSGQEALRECARAGRPASLLALDLDHFKSVNDMHGHAAGDSALQAAVAACQSRLRSIDVFGRLGGEEFAILLPDCPSAIAAQRAEEMRQAIAASSADTNVLVTASFGVAGTEACGHNLVTLLAHADNALYAAKRAGRNRVAQHEPTPAPAAT